MTTTDPFDALASVPPLPVPRAAGFWPRLGAFVIDCIVMAVVGNVLGLILFNSLAAAGFSARIVGFAIALAYFGIMNSQLGGRQTLGKRLLSLRVERTDGSLLPLLRSMARYTVLAIPFFSNGVFFTVDTWSATSVLLGVVVLLAVSMAIAIVYLFVFNRPTRRSLHDLLVDSCVVPAALTQPPGRTRVWRGHWVALAVIAVVIIGGAAASFFTHALPGNPGELARTQTAAAHVPGVRTVGVLDTTMVQFHGPTTRFISVNALLDDNRTDDEDLARSIARVVMATYPAAAQRQFIVVTLRYGYDVGIASSWRSHAVRFAPDTL